MNTKPVSQKEKILAVLGLMSVVIWLLATRLGVTKYGTYVYPHEPLLDFLLIVWLALTVIYKALLGFGVWARLLGRMGLVTLAALILAINLSVKVIVHTEWSPIADLLILVGLFGNLFVDLATTFSSD